jgi:hypothetical protein
MKGEIRNACKSLIGKPVGRRPLGIAGNVDSAVVVRELVYNDARWVEVSENHVQKRDLVSAELDVPVLLISDRVFKMS